MSAPLAASPSGAPTPLSTMLADADADAAAILKHDRSTPGFAIETVRAIVRRLSVADAAAASTDARLGETKHGEVWFGWGAPRISR